MSRDPQGLMAGEYLRRLQTTQPQLPPPDPKSPPLQPLTPPCCPTQQLPPSPSGTFQGSKPHLSRCGWDAFSTGVELLNVEIFQRICIRHLRAKLQKHRNKYRVFLDKRTKDWHHLCWADSLQEATDSSPVLIFIPARFQCFSGLLHSLTGLSPLSRWYFVISPNLISVFSWLLGTQHYRIELHHKDEFALAKACDFFLLYFKSVAFDRCRPSLSGLCYG